MEEYLFIGIIIVLVILDSIARSRKAKERGQAPPQGGADDGRAPDGDWEVPSHDDEGDGHGDYDIPGELLPTYEGAHASASSRGGARRPSSEGVIPADIWEEISDLARGERQEVPQLEPTPAPVPTRSTRVPARYTASRPAHRVHDAHEGYGTDPSGRARSAQDGSDPLEKTLSRDAATVRSMLTAKGTHALRQAVVLHEVLASPVSMRDDESY